MTAARLLPFIAVLLATSAAVAQSPRQPAPAAPRLYSVPAAAAPGRTTEVTFYGLDFGDADGLWTSFPATAERVPGRAKPPDAGDASPGVTYRLTVPAYVPVGVAAVRVATASGTSSLLPFLIDDLPTARDAAPDSPLAAPAAVEGACEPAAVRRIRVPAKKGQRLAFEVVAARLGSRLDPVLRLVDGRGRELGWSDDAPGAGADARFDHTFAADGVYVVEVRDVNYEGGPDYRFRLRVGDFPLVAATIPLAVRRGGGAMVAIDGPGCDRLGPVGVTPTGDAPRAWVNVRRDGGQGAGFAAVLVTDADEAAEAEPNDKPETANPLPVPGAVSGRFDRRGDRDYFRFDAKKGERLRFRARGRSLGLAAEPLLRLYKPDGTPLAQAKPADAKPGDTKQGTPATLADEAAVDATIPEDGTYRLSVEDLAAGGGPAAAYRVEAERVRPDFALSVDVEKVEAAAGGSFAVKVACARRDYGGPIELSVVGLEKGFEVEKSSIPAGKDQAELKVKVAADVKPGPPRSFTIVGRATVEGEERSHAASTAAALKRLFPRLAYPPPEWDGLIGLGIRP